MKINVNVLFLTLYINILFNTIRKRNHSTIQTLTGRRIKLIHMLDYTRLDSIGHFSRYTIPGWLGFQTYPNSNIYSHLYFDDQIRTICHRSLGSRPPIAGNHPEVMQIDTLAIQLLRQCHHPGDRIDLEQCGVLVCGCILESLKER